MQLTYRNAQYQVQQANLPTIPTGEIGTYRGAKVQFKAVERMSHVGFSILTYRGKQYRKLHY